MCKVNAIVSSKDISSYNSNEDTNVKFNTNSTGVNKVTENPANVTNPLTINTLKKEAIIPNIKKRPLPPPYCLLSNKTSRKLLLLLET